MLTKEEKFDIHGTCKRYKIENYTINDDGSIDVFGNVDIIFSGKYLTELPLNFNTVVGSIWCNNNKLTTLKGSPKTITGHFNCDNNELTSLEFAPLEVGGNFPCDYNKITTLKGCPSIIGNGFNLQHNLLESLEYYPKKVGGIQRYNSNRLPVMFTHTLDKLNRADKDLVLKYMNYYEVWKDGFDLGALEDLVAEIKDGLM